MFTELLLEFAIATSIFKSTLTKDSFRQTSQWLERINLPGFILFVDSQMAFNDKDVLLLLSSLLLLLSSTTMTTTLSSKREDTTKINFSLFFLKFRGVGSPISSQNDARKSVKSLEATNTQAKQIVMICNKLIEWWRC